MNTFHIEDPNLFEIIKTLKLKDKIIQGQYNFKMFTPLQVVVSRQGIDSGVSTNTKYGVSFFRVNTTEQLKKLDELFKLLATPFYEEDKVPYCSIEEKNHVFFSINGYTEFYGLNEKGDIVNTSFPRGKLKTVPIIRISGFKKTKNGWRPMLSLKTCFILPTPQTPIPQTDNCKLCVEKQKEDIFIPCGHFSVCTTCSDKLSYCPVCRRLITRKINLKDIVKTLSTLN